MYLVYILIICLPATRLRAYRRLSSVNKNQERQIPFTGSQPAIRNVQVIVF